MEEPIVDTLYRGFTPSHIDGVENSQYLMDRPYGLKLFKLNGGFEIAETSTGFAIDYRNNVTNPVMVLPSGYQDYSSGYFQSVFDKAALTFRRADLVLFLGYSFPPEDILVRRLTALLLENGRPRIRKHIICVNKSGSQTLKKRLSEIFGATNRSTLDLTVYNLKFSAFCEGCNYYYRKLRDGGAMPKNW